MWSSSDLSKEILQRRSPLVGCVPRYAVLFGSLTYSRSIDQGAAIAAYPLDTIRRRMMMTSGEKVDNSTLVLFPVF